MSHDSWKHIRPVAVGVPTRSDGREVLVGEHEAPRDGAVFYRPLGGGIDFGERSDDAVTREFREQVDATFAPEGRLAVLENRFETDGEAHHEIVFVYAGRLVQDWPYERESFEGHEERGKPFRVLWKDVEDFREGDALYPSGLLDVLS